MATRLVCFDLDGTLVSGTTSMLFMSEKFGFLERVREYERLFSAGLMTNIQAADLTAREFSDLSLCRIEELYSDVPKISNIDIVIAALKKRGITTLLASITWTFMVAIFARRYGFDAYCGTEMETENNILTGVVSHYCTEQDKAQFFLDSCRKYGVELKDAIAIGDSRSDHLIFKKASLSIALNADVTTKKLATCHLDTDDLSDILPLIN